MRHVPSRFSTSLAIETIRGTLYCMSPARKRELCVPSLKAVRRTDLDNARSVLGVDYDSLAESLYRFGDLIHYQCKCSYRDEVWKSLAAVMSVGVTVVRSMPYPSQLKGGK